MANKRVGKRTVKLQNNPTIISAASVVGPKVGQGPLKEYFNLILQDDLYGEKSWELAESKMVQTAMHMAAQKAGKKLEDINYLIGGDLINQIVPSSFAARELGIPFFGIYGACSTMAEGMCLSAMLIDGGFADLILSGASSHYCTAERQFRYPLEYGIQRKETMTFTATGSCAVYLSCKVSKVKIESITLGKVIDYDQYDANDMGRAMAPAALDTYLQHMKDLKRDGTYYDLILTGDLSNYGKKIMKDLLKEENQKYNEYDDCGCLLYDITQNIYQGGSGPVCNALVSFGYIYQMILKGKYKRVLVLATGALLNPVMTNQKLSIPCVCHGYVLEGVS